MKVLGINGQEISPMIKQSHKRTHRMENLSVLIIDAVIIVLICLACRFVIDLGYCPSESMEPSIYNGDFLIGVRTMLNPTEEIKRGDIICFNSDIEGENMDVCKRVIGLPGDSVSFRNGYVYINDSELDESAYLPANTVTASFRDFDVPDGSFFVLGDNRGDSYDSRYWANPFVSFDSVRSVHKITLHTHDIVNKIDGLISSIKK